MEKPYDIDLLRQRFYKNYGGFAGKEDGYCTTNMNKLYRHVFGYQNFNHPSTEKPKRKRKTTL